MKKHESLQYYKWLPFSELKDSVKSVPFTPKNAWVGKNNDNVIENYPHNSLPYVVGWKVQFQTTDYTRRKDILVVESQPRLRMLAVGVGSGTAVHQGHPHSSWSTWNWVLVVLLILSSYQHVYWEAASGDSVCACDPHGISRLNFQLLVLAWLILVCTRHLRCEPAHVRSVSVRECVCFDLTLK